MVRLIKALKDVLSILSSNAKACIGDGDQHETLVIGTGSNRDGSTWWCEFDGVGDQVVQYLLHTLRVNIEQWRGRGNILIDCNICLERLRLQATYHLPCQDAKIHLFRLDL